MLYNPNLRDSLIGNRYIDKRGIGCIIDKEVYRHPTSWKKDKLLLKFDNKTERVYSKLHIAKRITDNKINVESSISAYEYIGKKYKDKHGNHECEVLLVIKQRYTYWTSIVRVKWDTGLETEHMLYKIVKSKIPYNRAINKSKADKYILKEYKPFIWRYGGYCEIPENNIDTVYPADALTKWKAMLTRCYKEKYQEKAYENVDVCDEWKNFYNFGVWYSRNYVKDWVLDKDLKGLDHYGPDACMLIPLKLNASLIIKPCTHNYPSGVYVTNLPGRKPYVSSVTIHGHTVNCDYHNDVMSAFMHAKIVKEYYIYQLSEFMFGDTKDTREFEIKKLCEEFQMNDKRYESNDCITESMIIKYLQDKTGSKNTNYYALRSLFVSQKYDFFNKRYKKVIDIMNQEFSESRP